MKLRDFSELKEAAELFEGLHEEQLSDAGLRVRGELLENCLRRACRRTGWNGLVFVDERGLLLAQSETLLPSEILLGLTLGMAELFPRSDSLLGAQASTRITMDYGGSSRLVLKRFAARNLSYLLGIECSPATDDERELELLTRELSSLIEGH